MCIVRSSKPNVEKVPPAPQVVNSTDTAAVNDQVTKKNRKLSRAKGAQWAAQQAQDTMLSATSSGKQRLGD